MPNRSLRTLFVFNGIFVFAGSLLGPLYALYVENLGQGILSVSITWTAFAASTFVCTVFVAKIGDMVKHKQRLLIVGFLIRAFAWLMFAFAGSILHIILIQILLGVGEAIGTPAFDALFAEHLDKGRHIKEYSEWKLVTHGMTAVGTLAGGVIVSSLGFDWLFVMMSGLALIACAGVVRQPRRLL